MVWDNKDKGDLEYAKEIDLNSLDLKSLAISWRSQDPISIPEK
jgi:hypothetical protein